MNAHQGTPCTAFRGKHGLASGPLRHVSTRVKEALDQGEDESILIFNDLDSRPVEVDFRGTLEEVLQRLPPEPGTESGTEPGPEPEQARDEQRGPGRPRLGVVAREVTLLPRHWDWLGRQPGGASVALRKLVEAARKTGESQERLRLARESAYRFMSAMAGNEPGFEEATRALFAGQEERFRAMTEPWAPDLRAHALKVAAAAFPEQTGGSPT